MGPIREDRAIENEPPVILQYKQRQRHLLNVRQQYNRKKAVRVSPILSVTCLLYSMRQGVYSVAELDFLVL